MSDEEKIKKTVECLLDLRDDLVRISNALGCNCVLVEGNAPLLKINALLRLLG